MRHRRRAPLAFAVGVAVLAVVAGTWPSPPQSGQRAALEALRAAPVPVLAPLVAPDWSVRAEVDADGYLLVVTPPGAPLLAVRASRSAPPPPPGSLEARGTRLRVGAPAVALGGPDSLKDVTWSEGGVTYTLTLPERAPNGETADRVERLEPLPRVLDALQAWPGDSVLLYGLYLPLLLAFAAWSAGSLLWHDGVLSLDGAARAG